MAKLSSTQARKILREFYKDIRPYLIPSEEESEFSQKHASSVYGEIGMASLDKLLKKLKIKKSDVFFDLGSGAGRVVMQTALRTNSQKIVGIELSKTRNQWAKSVLREAKAKKMIHDGRVEFRNGDILKASLHDGTIFYACSTTFPRAFMKKLTTKLKKLKQDFVFVTLQPLPKNAGFEQVDQIYLDMSWMRNTPVYFYKKSAHQV